MSEVQYGSRKRIIADLCRANPDWSSADLMRETGWRYSQVRGAFYNLGIKPRSKYKSIPIDKGIPVAKIAYGLNREFKYPWRDMEIGDSFLFPTGSNYWTAAVSVRDQTQRLGKTFSFRSTAEGLRCWRIA